MVTNLVFLKTKYNSHIAPPHPETTVIELAHTHQTIMDSNTTAMKLKSRYDILIQYAVKNSSEENSQEDPLLK